MKSYYLTTLGCPKNQADSRQMERSLQAAGFPPARSANEADVHLINSCAFIESAREQTIQTVLEAHQLRHHPDQKLVLVGCFSERYAAAIASDLPEVDLAFGTGQYSNAADLILEHFEWSVQRSSVAFGQSILTDSNSPAGSLLVASNSNRFGIQSEQSIWAPLKISDGCNRGCSFCAIPLMRGKFEALPAAHIIEEAHSLVADGVREICLVSQDTNQYGSGIDVMIDLIEELHQIPELEWLRLLYMYPDPRTLQIYQKLAERGLPKFVPYLESPVQHVADTVLRSMRRFGSYEYFVDFFGTIRELFTDLELRTSFLVGYPNESEADVDELIRFVQEIRPEKLSLFSYSPEEDTQAWSLADPISTEQKARRLNRIREAHLEVLSELHQSRMGQIYNCMIDKKGLDNSLVVRRPQDAPEIDEQVFVDLQGVSASRIATLQPGQIVAVEINGFYEYDMTGRLS